jgi:hypothetical protein
MLPLVGDDGPFIVQILTTAEGVNVLIGFHKKPKVRVEISLSYTVLERFLEAELHPEPQLLFW